MFSFFENRAAKLYARLLPRRLSQSYGSSSHYTAAQIRTAAIKLKLPGKYLCLGYAAFLTAEEYELQAKEAPFPFSYETARAKLARFAPPTAFSTSGNAVAENPYVSLFTP